MRKTIKIVVVILIIIGGLAGTIWAFRFVLTGLAPRPFQSMEIGELGQSFNPQRLIGPLRDRRAEYLSPEQIVLQTNQEREAGSQAPLASNPLLQEAAQKKVSDMFEKQYFDHNSPDGTTPAELVAAAGYQYKLTGENLAMGDFNSEAELVAAWMESPGHRENILKKEYTEIGVAAKLGKIDGRMTWLAVQEFGRPAPQCPLPDLALKQATEDKKSELETVAGELERASLLFKEGANLISRGNQKIEEGNNIQSTDPELAEKLWEEGGALQGEGQTKIDQGKAIRDSTSERQSKLVNEINAMVEQYNQQAKLYNHCLEQ